MACERYEPVAELSCSLGSRVDLVRDTSNSKECVRKTTFTEGLDAALMELLSREAEIMSSLEHSHVVQLIAADEADGMLVRIFEYLPGGDCHSLLEKASAALSEDFVARIVGQVMSALAYCHAAGVIHRDVKPENILLTASGPGENPHCKLADFGYAVKANRRLLSEPCGTEAYVAPEMLLSSPCYDEKVDVWSCGVSAFELLFGKLPFGCEVAANTIRRYRRSNDPEMELVTAASEDCWRSLSDNGQDFLRLVLCPDPKRRPSAGEAADHPWLSKAFRSERLVQSGLVGGA